MRLDSDPFVALENQAGAASTQDLHATSILSASAPKTAPVIDPFAGSNTTGEVAQEMGRYYLAFELEEAYLESSRYRFSELDPDGEVEPSGVRTPEDEQQTLFSSSPAGDGL